MSDTIIELMDDMHLGNKNLFNTYYNDMVANNIDDAQSIISSNTSLQNQITNSENVNAIINDVNARELRVKTDIDYFLDNLNDEFQQMINDMKVMGTYSSTVQYYENNLVYYNNMGYYCFLTPPIGTVPTDTTYWKAFDIKGLQGYGGIALNLKYEYTDTYSYSVGDVVTYQNKVWMAIVPTQGVPPNLNHYPWALIMVPGVQQKTLIQKEQPTNRYDGSFWFKILSGDDLIQSSWKEMASQPNVSYASYVFAIGNDIYSCCGEGANFYPTNTVNCYDTTTNTWSVKASTPSAYASIHAGASVGTKGYMIAGQKGITRELCNDVLVYDSTTNVWTTTTSFPESCTTSVAAIGDKIYAFGCAERTIFLKNSYVFDTTTSIWTQIADLPFGLNAEFVDAIGENIYIISGYTLINGTEQIVSSMYVYNTTNNTYSQLADIPTPRTFGATFIKGNEIYCVGGLNSLGYSSNKNEKYNITTNTWSEDIPMLNYRNSCNGVTINNKGYVTPGLNLQYSTIIPTIEQYTFNAIAPNLSLQINVTDNTSFTFPTQDGGTFNYYIDWGDGNISNQITTYDSTDRIHTYTTGGNYVINLYGTCDLWNFYNSTNATNIIQVISCNLALKSLDNLFNGCINLNNIPEDIFYNSSNVTSGNSIFNNCSSLTTIPNNLFVNNTQLTSLSSAFYGCSNITKIPSTLLNSNSNLTAIDNLFCGCSNLTQIPYGLFLGNINLQNISGTFSSCTNLTTMPSYLFSPCINVNNISTLLNGCTNLVSIENNCFYNSLFQTTNFDNVFKGDSKLNNLELIDMSNATSVTEMFNGCSSLTTLGGFKGLSISLDLSSCSLLTTTSLLNVLSNLATVTTSQTLTLGTSNLSKLSDEQKAIATNKGWTLA